MHISFSLSKICAHACAREHLKWSCNIVRVSAPPSFPSLTNGLSIPSRNSLYPCRIMLISEKEQLLSELMRSLRLSKDKTAQEKLEVREQISKLEQEVKGESEEFMELLYVGKLLDSDYAARGKIWFSQLCMIVYRCRAPLLCCP